MAEGVAEVFGEGLEVDVFDGFEADVGLVEFASALGLADVDPVGGAVSHRSPKPTTGLSEGAKSCAAARP